MGLVENMKKTDLEKEFKDEADALKFIRKIRKELDSELKWLERG
jgi:hypothetical protein